MNKQIDEMTNIMNQTCNVYDEQGNHIRNKCGECDCWSDDNHCCCSYNTKEAIALYNAGYRKQSEWIGVGDGLPDTKDRVLVYIEANHLNEVAIDTDRVVDGRWVRWGTLVTHWMPLPEAPKKKYESEGAE